MLRVSCEKLASAQGQIPQEHHEPDNLSVMATSDQPWRGRIAANIVTDTGVS